MAAISRTHSFSQIVPLENQTRGDVVGQIGRSVTPLVWSWIAVRRKKADPWRFAGLSVRTTLSTATRKEEFLQYDRVLVFAETVDARTAAERFASLDPGPTASGLGLTLELMGDDYMGYRLPAGSSYGFGPTSTWPEYYMNWPLAADNEARYAASLSDPISGPGSPAFKHGYEPMFSKLFGVRQIPHGSFEPPLSASVRVLYPYRIGDVWFNDGNFVSYVDWLGKGEPQQHSLQISIRWTAEDPDPETQSSIISGATTAVAITCESPPAEADLFLTLPDTGAVWDSRTWLPDTAGLPVTITPDVEEEDEIKKVVSALPTDDLEKLASDPEFSALLRTRWIEIQTCLDAKAFLAATVVAGSLLEGALLAFALQREKSALAAKSAPRDKGGASLPLPKWTLEKLIDVATELHWIGHGLLRMADVVRTLRNAIHPWEARKSQGSIDKATAEICFDVVQKAMSQLAASTSS